MRRNPMLLAALALVVASCGRPNPETRPERAEQPARIVGYLASWGVRSNGTRIADLPGDRLTHISGGVMAWEIGGDDGTLVRAITRALRAP